MVYNYFNKNEQFYNDIEEYINGCINTYEITEAYKPVRIVRALKTALQNQIDEYHTDSGWNRVAILSAKSVVEQTIEEFEEDYPLDEYPEIWL